MKTLFLFIFTTVVTTGGQQTTKFHVIRQWKYLNFTWPSEEVYKTATADGLYIPENNIIAGMKYFQDYYYITLPRMKSGVPATLTRIKAGPPGEASPKLEPFPSWTMNMIEDCNNLQNVQNIEIDTDGLMWIIDGGRINTLDNPVIKCSPKLVIYDLKENRTATVFTFPEEVAKKESSFLYDIVVDNSDGGYAYITDNSAHDPGIIVYSMKESRSWKVRHPSMVADPSATLFTVNGISIPTPLNLAGIALGPKIHTSNNQKVVVNEDDRQVYFSPISSLHLYTINTTVLRNERPSSTNYNDSIVDLGRKESQSGAMIMDNQGILYYTLLGMNAVGRWDSHTPFHSGRRLIARDAKFLEWPSSLAMDQSAGNLTVVVNRLNRFIFGKIDLNEINFVLITAHVGGKSYLYDENFSYQTDNGRSLETSSAEPSSSSEPVPSPEPDLKNSSTTPGAAVVTKTTTHSSANQIVVNLGFLVLSLSLLSVK